MLSARSWTARATKVLILSPSCSAAFDTMSCVESSKYPVTGRGKPLRGRRRLLRSPFSGIRNSSRLPSRMPDRCSGMHHYSHDGLTCNPDSHAAASNDVLTFSASRLTDSQPKNVFDHLVRQSKFAWSERSTSSGGGQGSTRDINLVFSRTKGLISPATLTGGWQRSQSRAR